MTDNDDLESQLNPKTVRELFSCWEAGSIPRHHFYVAILPLVNEANIDEVMKSLPKGVRMYLFRKLARWLDTKEPYANMTEIEADGFAVMARWASLNIDYVRALAFPAFKDPDDIDGLLRLRREHALDYDDFDRIIANILNAGDAVQILRQFPDDEKGLLMRWARIYVVSQHRSHPKLSTEAARQVQEWYVENTSVPRRRTH